MRKKTKVLVAAASILALAGVGYVIGDQAGLGDTPYTDAASPRDSAEPAAKRLMSPRDSVSKVRCEEDEPCWDWREMGNRSADAWLVIDREQLQGTVTYLGDGEYLFTVGD